MAYLLGIDGGGTKTAMRFGAAAGEDAAAEAEVVVGATSLTRRPAAAVAAELRRGLEGRDGADCVACRAGFASAGNAARRTEYLLMLRELLPKARLEVSNDVAIALEAASGGDDAIVVIAGTGSAAAGRYRGRSAESGGLGPGVGDEGSADWMGRRAEQEGLVAPGAAFASHLGAVVELADSGNAAAGAIVAEAAFHLAQLARQVAAELDWARPAVYGVGGVFQYAPPVLARMRALLPTATIALATTSPAEGALRLARALAR